MNKLLNLIWVLFFVFLSYPISAQSQNDSLYIESVDYRIQTFKTIPCDLFASSFAGRVNFKAIIDKDSIAILSAYIDKAKYSRSDRSVNIRAKFILERKDNSRVVICTDGYNILIDNRLLKRNEKFAQYLRLLTGQK